jgi:2-phosphoglycerate kinase
MINKVGPMFISGKLEQLANKTGITDVIGKDAVRTGREFIRKGLTDNLV